MSDQTAPFPEYMNSQAADGTRSEGPAVMALQMFLLGCLMVANRSWGNLSGRIYLRVSGDYRHFWPTGVYDPATIAAVMELQWFLGFTGDDVDGNFGPATRQRLEERMDVDITRVFTQFPGKGWYAQDDGTMVEWELIV